MARYRVLVVDDEAMVTEVIERYLIRDGFDVSTTGDGDDAVSLTQT
jgi:DNA-binding response OmpR family regulator